MVRVLALLPVLLGLPDAALANEALWDLLKSGGQVAVIRHASTVPGFGDPPGFRVEDCSTQRNLSTAGREEARRIGQPLAMLILHSPSLTAVPYTKSSAALATTLVVI